MPSERKGPAELEGEALRQWYLRSPDEIEAERRTAQEAQYRAFFGSEASGTSRTATNDDVDGDDDLWVATGDVGFRRTRRPPSDFQTTLEPADDTERPGYLPAKSAAIEAGTLQDVGNPHNPRLRREWEQANGRAWPRTADGRAYDVAHIRAIADGGTNTLDNIRPMDPATHRASHADDARRWARRSHIARTFGGKVEPPAHAPKARPRLNSVGVAGVISNLAGLLSGSVRLDTPEHFWFDMAGFPAPGDEDLVVDPACRAMGITKPGLKCT